MGVQLARAGVAALGLLLILSALGVMVAGGPVAFLPAVVLFTSGAVLLVGSVAERLRYRSIAAERDGHPPGPAPFSGRGRRRYISRPTRELQYRDRQIRQ